MSSYDGEDEDSYNIPSRGAPPRQQQPPPRRYQSTSSRQPSVISESSHAESSRRGNSFLSRLESTLSPSNRSSKSLGPTDDESYPGGGMGGYEDSLYNGNGGHLDMGEGDTESGVDFDLEEEEQSDVALMGAAWVRERGTPEIMKWEGELIDGLFDKLEQQAKMVSTLRSDPQTSEEEHFKLVLVETEMERVKYLIRSYVRCRLAKIERYSHYIVLNEELHNLLSGAELSHARRLPEWLRKMDDTYGDGLSMVSKPNRNVPVLVYCRKDCGEISLEGGETAALAKGTTHLVKYHLVENWIKLGWAEVL